MKNYPCDSCRKVANPEKCENKKCGAWQKWFTQRWEATRRSLLYGIPLEAVKPDPCSECVCPPGLCDGACKEKQAWRIEVTQ